MLRHVVSTPCFLRVLTLQPLPSASLQVSYGLHTSVISISILLFDFLHFNPRKLISLTPAPSLVSMVTFQAVLWIPKPYSKQAIHLISNLGLYSESLTFLSAGQQGMVYICAVFCLPTLLALSVPSLEGKHLRRWATLSYTDLDLSSIFSWRKELRKCLAFSCRPAAS